MIDSSSDYHIQSDPNGQFVSAWSAWHLPYMNLSPVQRQYRSELRESISRLKASGHLRATYTSLENTRGLDTENVLFYNVGASVLREAATNTLRFERIKAPTPEPPNPLGFARHHVRYQVEPRNKGFRYVEADPLAHCTPVVCSGRKEIKDPASLWRLFKLAAVSGAQSSWSPGNEFSVQLVISAPVECRLNLADIVKPLMDAFISALHHYDGKQLDQVVGRLGTRPGYMIQKVRELLIEKRHAVLGPRAVPHLRGDGLQWSPADEHLIAGEIVRETSPAGSPIKISGCLFSAA